MEQDAMKSKKSGSKKKEERASMVLSKGKKKKISTSTCKVQKLILFFPLHKQKYQMFMCSFRGCLYKYGI